MTIKSGMLTMRRRQKKEVIFRISIKDGFYDTPINETAEATVTTGLRLFIAELAQNQKKPLVLSAKVDCYF
jgi:hypothetical protein